MLKAAFKGKLDIEALTKRMGNKNRRVLFATGRDTLRAMRRGMRSGGKSRKASKPGGYPNYHRGRKGGLRAILFKVNEDAGTVKVGPMKFPRSGNVPEIVNFGGDVTYTVTIDRMKSPNKKRPKVTAQDRKRRQTPGVIQGGKKIVRFNIQPRPYIALTFPAAKESLRKNITQFLF